MFTLLDRRCVKFVPSISPKFAMGDQRVTSYPVAVRQGKSVGKLAVVYEITLLAPKAEAVSRRIGLPRGKHWALL